MGNADGQDQRVFETLKQVIDHGQPQWWLYASRCTKCDQKWMIAQEERIHDNFYFRRLTEVEMSNIIEKSKWPSEFLRFEDVIRLGPDNKQICSFFNSDDLTDTVKELIEERETISVREVSYLFCLSDDVAARLMRRARATSWAKLRPFA